MSKEKIKSRWLFFGKDKYTYDTIDELVNKSMGLAVGEVVTLNGYYSADDGATHKRVIADTDDGSGVQLRNNLWANIVHNGEVNVSWFGAKGDGIFDNNICINKCIQFCSRKNLKIYFPKGAYIFNISPELDVSNFIGYGIIKTTDKWGHRHDFNVEWCEKGYPYTVKDIINHSLNLKKNCYIGMLGDSITDGAWADGWVINPTGADGNLNSTNYDHSKNGGKNSWFVKFTNLLNEIENIFKPCNASLSGAKLIDGWAYRNYDYGFFQNQAYGNKAPEICYLAMGVNDAGQATSKEGYELYRKEFDKFIRKAWGYGSAVTLVSVNKIMPIWLYVENSLKRDLPKFYKGVEYIDVFNGLEKITVNGNYSFDELWKKTDGSIDTCHPQQIGHNIMGEYMFAYTMSELMITNNSYIPNTNKIRIIGESGTKYEALMGGVGGIPYLDKFGKYPYIELKEKTTFTYYIYNTESNKSLTVFHLYGYEGIGEINVKITNNGGTYAEYNFGKPKINEYTSHLVPILAIGLNKIEITFNYINTGKKVALYSPMLIIKDFGEKDFINFKGYGFDNVIRPIGYNFGNENFSFLSGRNFLADKVAYSEYPYHISLEIKNYLDNGLFQNGVGVLFFYKEGCGKSILLVYENGFKLYYFDNVTKKKIKLIGEYSLITQREDLILTVSYNSSESGHDFTLKNSTQVQGIQAYEYNITGGRLATYSEVGLVYCYFEYYTSLY